MDLAYEDWDNGVFRGMWEHMRTVTSGYSRSHDHLDGAAKKQWVSSVSPRNNGKPTDVAERMIGILKHRYQRK